MNDETTVACNTFENGGRCTTPPSTPCNPRSLVPGRPHASEASRPAMGRPHKWANPLEASTARPRNKSLTPIPKQRPAKPNTSGRSEATRREGSTNPTDGVIPPRPRACAAPRPASARPCLIAWSPVRVVVLSVWRALGQQREVRVWGTDLQEHKLLDSQELGHKTVVETRRLPVGQQELFPTNDDFPSTFKH